MGKYPPDRTRHLRQMKTLQAGEDSRTYRIRAPDPVHTWLGDMTAEQRGELLARVMLDEAGRGQSAPGRLPPPSRPSEGQIERLILGTVPPDRALTPYQRGIVAGLRDGATLSREHRGPWRLAYPLGGAESLRGDSVQNLLDLGALREVSPQP